jgi:hypothetical protein
MGSVSLVACLRTDVWLKRTASMVLFGIETEAGPLGHSARLRGGVGSSESVQLCWVSVKGCHVWGLSTESVRVAYVDWRKKRTWHVYQVSPTGCTLIRIIATLKHE